MEGARLEAGCMIAPGSVVPPGRLRPAKQLWGGNPVEFVRELNVAEVFSNYSYSYIHYHLGEAHKVEFTAWPSNYLEKVSAREDVDVEEQEKISLTSPRNGMGDWVKHYV